MDAQVIIMIIKWSMDSSNWIQRKFKKFNTDYVSNVIIILSMDFNDMALDPSNVILI